MRFIDASVFLYAYLKPKKELPGKLKKMKERAKGIVKRVDEGEKVVTTIVHLSEIANIIESKASLMKSIKVVLSILNKPNIIIMDVTKSAYLEAAKCAELYGVGVNDALAYITMRNLKIREIYSFDTDFDKLKDIERLTK